MIRLLLVEDEDLAVENFMETLTLTGVETEIMVAKSRDHALHALATCDLDLIVCDLVIPSTDGVLDASVNHGFAVHAAARAQMPGVPAIFLTGYPEERGIHDSLSDGPVAQIYGPAKIPLVRLVAKGDVDALLSCLKLYLESLSGLQEVEVECQGATDPESMLVRACQHYVATIGGLRAVLVPFGGSSGAEVGRLEVTLDGGFKRTLVVKTQSMDRVGREQDAYEQHVPTSLASGYFAPAVTPQLYGLRRSGANLYALASGGRNLFDVLRADPRAAAALVHRMASMHAPWTAHSVHRSQSIGELRRTRNRTPRTDALVAADSDLSAIESRSMDLAFCTCHGDLHGANVVVGDSGDPQLIDFGDVGFGLSALDPITLELSLLFNPSGPLHGTEYPPLELSEWHDVNSYCSQSPYFPFIQACRAWAQAVSDQDTLLVTAYVHSMRQLKYSDVPARVPAELARGIASAIRR